MQAADRMQAYQKRLTASKRLLRGLFTASGDGASSTGEASSLKPAKRSPSTSPRCRWDSFDDVAFRNRTVHYVRLVQSGLRAAALRDNEVEPERNADRTNHCFPRLLLVAVIFLCLGAAMGAAFTRQPLPSTSTTHQPVTTTTTPPPRRHDDTKQKLAEAEAEADLQLMNATATEESQQSAVQAELAHAAALAADGRFEAADRLRRKAVREEEAAEAQWRQAAAAVDASLQKRVAEIRQAQAAADQSARSLPARPPHRGEGVAFRTTSSWQPSTLAIGSMAAMAMGVLLWGSRRRSPPGISGQEPLLQERHAISADAAQLNLQV